MNISDRHIISGAAPSPADDRSRVASNGEVSIQVMLVDDHPVVVEGVRRMIDSQAGLRVCSTAGSCREAWECLNKLHPDVLVIDITLTDGDGLDFVYRANKLVPQLRTLVMSMHDEYLYAERALRAGAYGYVMKESPREVFLKALHSVARGEFHFSQGVDGTLMANHQDSGATLESRLRRLSDRELQVFHLMGRGWTSMRIAVALGISASTVDSHRTHLREKLGVPTLSELTRCAVAWLSGSRSGSVGK